MRLGNVVMVVTRILMQKFTRWVLRHPVLKYPGWVILGPPVFLFFPHQGVYHDYHRARSAQI